MPAGAFDLTRPGTHLGPVYSQARQRAYNATEYPGMARRQRDRSRGRLLSLLETREWFSLLLRWNPTQRALSLRPALAAVPSAGQRNWPDTLIQCAPVSSSSFGAMSNSSKIPFPSIMMSYPTTHDARNHTQAVGAFGTVGSRLFDKVINIVPFADDALHFAQTRSLVHEPSTTIVPVYARCRPLDQDEGFQFAVDEKELLEAQEETPSLRTPKQG